MRWIQKVGGVQEYLDNSRREEGRRKGERGRGKGEKGRGKRIEGRGKGGRGYRVGTDGERKGNGEGYFGDRRAALFYFT